MKLIEMILSKMIAIHKPQKKFLSKVFQAYLGVNGKLTFRNMSRYIDLCEKTFSRQFSKVFNFSIFNQKAIEMALTSQERKIAVAFDPFFMSKAGNKTYGRGDFWSGSSGRIEKGIEASVLCVIDLIKWTGYALAAKQTPNSEELSKLGAEINRVDWYLQYVISMIPMFPLGVKYLLVDAYFFKEKFVSGIREAGLHVVSKMRKDARLVSLYTGPQKARGRRKIYGDTINFDDLNDIATNDPGIILKSSIAYSIALKREVLVVAVRKLRTKGKVMEATLFSTDLEMTPVDVYQYYKSRFQIEFVIRDAKQHTGLNDFQSRAKERIDFHINISFSAINIAKIKEQERFAGVLESTAYSIATQHVKHHNEMLIQSIFPMFGLDPLAFKSHPNYERALSYGAVNG